LKRGRLADVPHARNRIRGDYDMADPKHLHAGARVRWASHGGHAEGKIVRKLSEPIEIKSHHVAASPDNPQWLVETDESRPRTIPRR